MRSRGSAPSYAVLGGGVALMIVALAGCGSSGSSNSAVFTPAPSGEGESPQQACYAASSAWSTFNASYVAGGGQGSVDVATTAENAFDAIYTELSTYLDYFPDASHSYLPQALMSDTNAVYGDLADLVALDTGQPLKYTPTPATSADVSARLTKDYGTFKSDCAKVPSS